MIPPAATNAAIADELPSAKIWAQRHGIVMDTTYIPDRILRLVLVQPDSNENFYLQGSFENYRAYPPLWQWYDDNWTSTDALDLSPKPSSQPSPFGNSIFIVSSGKGLICAPFNRLAYGVHGGPHSDWGNPAQWMTVGKGNVYAVKLGDMLNSILCHFRNTSGRMQ